MQILITTDLDDAVQKGNVDMKATIPASLTPQKVLELDKKMKDLILKVMNGILQELAQEGQAASLDNPLFLKKLSNSDMDELM